MKNKVLYDEYAVIGYPNIFFTSMIDEMDDEDFEKNKANANKKDSI